MFHSISYYMLILFFFSFFFFNDTATTEIYTLSLHDALPISNATPSGCPATRPSSRPTPRSTRATAEARRSEEHTSELQSLAYLVCRLLLEKKKKKHINKRIIEDKRKLNQTGYRAQDYGHYSK